MNVVWCWVVVVFGGCGLDAAAQWGIWEEQEQVTSWVAPTSQETSSPFSDWTVGEYPTQASKLQISSPSSSTLEEYLETEETNTDLTTSESSPASTTLIESSCTNPPAVQSLNINVTSPVVVLTWDLETDLCVKEYIVYVDDLEYGRSFNREYTIDDLAACSNYTMGVTVSYGDILGARSEETVYLDTPDPFSYKVEDLSITRIENNALNVTWIAPNQVAKCIKGYNVVYWDQNGKSKDSKTIDSYFEIFPVIGCMEYTVQIVPVVTNERQGQSQQAGYTSGDLPTNPPKKISVERGKNSASISWSTDTYAVNMCSITEFLVTCEALDENNANYDWLVRNRNVTETVNDSSSTRPIFIINVDELSEFTNYTCYGYVVNSGGRSNASDVVTFQTLPTAPSAPESLVLIQVSSTSFTIQWTEPLKVPGVLTNYAVQIDNHGPNHYVGDVCLDMNGTTVLEAADVYQYTFEEAYPNYHYTVSVFGIDEAGNGTSATIEITTQVAMPPAPLNLQDTSFIYEEEEDFIYNVTVEIRWDTPCNTNGPLKGFQLAVEGCYTENRVSETCSETSDSHFIAKHDDDQDVGYSFNITDIKNSYLYIVNISAVLSETDIEGETGSISFVSPDGYPGPPVLENAANETDKSFELFWSEPQQKYGKIVQYEVTIENQGALYEVPAHEECRTNTSKLTSAVSADVLKFKFEDGLPYYNYTAYVRAETKAGFGARSNLTYVVTNQSEPEPVRNPKIEKTYWHTEQYRGVALIKYDLPCKTNGVFRGYRIIYKGSRPGYPKHEDSILIDHKNYSIDLRPDHNYAVGIEVVAEQFNSSSYEEYFHSQPGVPVPGDNLEAPVSNVTTRAYFRFSKSAFNDSNGVILYYALFLFPSDMNVTGKSYGFWNGTKEGWPSAPVAQTRSFIPYQITDTMWNPFEDKDAVDVNIGTNTNCSSHISCNKPLSEDTAYVLIIRALTSSTYKDSRPLEFRTTARSLDIGLILGIIFGLLAAAVLIVFIVILWRRKKRTFIEEESQRSSTSDPGPIDVKKFVTHYDYVKDNYNVIKAQFSLLGVKSKEFESPITFAVLPENRRKNRYSNILPYDETRVKLQIDEDDEIASDYINASYIKGYSGKTEYIATQGPLEHTTKDFWKMVHQENVTMVVMVSQFVEQSREKCHKYFPNNHESMKLADNLEVKCSTELHFGTYCVRTLELKRFWRVVNNGNNVRTANVHHMIMHTAHPTSHIVRNIKTNDVSGEGVLWECDAALMDTVQRIVIHIQFLEWPDFGVPMGTENMLDFCCQMRDRMKSEGGIIAIHCSAGVGRTGTLIAIDILLQTINDHRDIDIFKTVLDLRQQRMNMVQTEKQYMFIHTCLRDALEGPVNQTYVKPEEPLYENLNIIKSALEDNLLPTESESAL